jgi:hypothetical protein
MLELEELYSEKHKVCVLVVDGRCDVRMYLGALSEREQSSLVAVMRLLAVQGFVANKERFNRLDSGIYEIKTRRPPHRLYCFQDGNYWICTHGSRKPGKREMQRHIAKVKALRTRLQEESGI